MPSTAAHQNARYLLHHTAAIADGVFTAATNLGPLASGSEIGPPEATLDDFQGGASEAQATLNHAYRVAGTPTLTTLQTAKDASPPTELYFFITNHGLTSYTQVGPCSVTQAIRLGASMEGQKASSMIRVQAKGDTAEDIYKVIDSAVTLP